MEMKLAKKEWETDGNQLYHSTLNSSFTVFKSNLISKKLINSKSTHNNNFRSSINLYFHSWTILWGFSFVIKNRIKCFNLY